MMLTAMLAASLSFTALATGVEKGTAVEFAFVGVHSDRDYEALFVLEESVGSLCQKLEQAGLEKGSPVDQNACRLWPVGRTVTIDPPLSQYVAESLPEGLQRGDAIFTGGSRLADGNVEASDTMPASFFSFYTLAQSPIVFNGIYDQGSVYGAFTAREKIKKGTRVRFTLSWNDTLPRHLALTARPGRGAELIRRLRDEAKSGEIDVTVGFDGAMTVAEAKSVACALTAIDSVGVKINGCSNVFYRSFMPLLKWTDRTQRLQQPFELTLGHPDKLVFIEEDWTVAGDDPKLTPRTISFSDAAKYQKTDTCFIYASNTNTVDQIVLAMNAMKNSKVKNWYVFDVQ